MKQLAKNAREGADALYRLSDKRLKILLSAICQKLSCHQESILEQNQKDVQNARSNGMSALRLQRLTLSPIALEKTIGQLQQLAEQSDLVNVNVREWKLPGNMAAAQKRIPLGAIAAVFESRPTASLEIMALCLRTGNSCILRSGSELLETNREIVTLTQTALRECGLSEKTVQLMEDCGEEALCRLMQRQELDLFLARGSQKLISLFQENAKVPWICLGPGNCHVYVDAAAKLDMAVEIISTAKSKPLLCNSVETVLVHQKIVAEFIPRLISHSSSQGITLRGCPKSCQLSADIQPISKWEYAVEANDFVLKIKVVDNLEQAAAHIKHFGSGHSEAIVTESSVAAERFTDMVDAGVVYVNASTRFTDGVSLGLGMEGGISTQKLHTRGPVTVEALTTWKYIVQGCGNTR